MNNIRRIFSVVAGAAVAAAAIAAHASLSTRSDEYTGLLLPLDHVYSLILVCALFALGAGVGGRLLRTVVPQLDPLERLLFSTVTGHAALATAILVAGLLWSVSVPVQVLLIGAAAWFGRNALADLPALCRDAGRSVLERADRLTLWIAGGVTAFLILRALAPATDWDALMYHLRVPDQFLAHGAIVRPEDNGHFAFVGLPHMLYLPLLAAGSPAGPALVSAGYAVGLAFAGFALAHRFLDGRTARAFIVALWGSAVIVLVGVTARTDTVLGLLLFMVQYAVLLARSTGDRRFLVLAAGLCGAAAGVKYTALLYLAALAPLVILLLADRRRDRMTTAAMLAGAALLGALPWLVKNAWLMGDPLYPYLTESRPEPWLARLQGSDRWPVHMDAAGLAQLWQAQGTFSLVDLFTEPGRISVEEEGSLYRPSLLLLLLPLWALCWRKSTLAWLGVPALGFGVVLLAFQPQTSVRYLIPVIAPLVLVVLFSLGAALDRFLRPAAAAAALLALSVASLAPSALALLPQTFARGHFQHAAGVTSRREMLRAGTGPYADAVTFVNEQLPADARLLLLWEARGYHLRVPVLQDNGIVNWPMLAARADPPGCLRSSGLTHVLVNEGALAYYRSRGMQLDGPHWGVLPRFAQACLDPLYSSGGISVFRLRPNGAPEP